MSKEWGILYHHGGRLRKDKGWSEKSYCQKWCLS